MILNQTFLSLTLHNNFTSLLWHHSKAKFKFLERYYSNSVSIISIRRHINEVETVVLPMLRRKITDLQITGTPWVVGDLWAPLPSRGWAGNSQNNENFNVNFTHQVFTSLNVAFSAFRRTGLFNVSWTTLAGTFILFLPLPSRPISFTANRITLSSWIWFPRILSSLAFRFLVEIPQYKSGHEKKRKYSHRIMKVETKKRRNASEKAKSFAEMEILIQQECHRASNLLLPEIITLSCWSLGMI